MNHESDGIIAWAEVNLHSLEPVWRQGIMRRTLKDERTHEIVYEEPRHR